MAARLVKVFHVRLNLGNEAANEPHPLAALTRGADTLRYHKASAEEHGQASLRPRAETSDDSSVRVLREMVAEDRGREPPVQTDIESNSSPAKSRSRRGKSDESLSVVTIAVTMAAVITIGFAFTALLPSILTRGVVESATALVTSPAVTQPAQPEPVVAIPPAPAPRAVEPPANAPPAPLPNTAESVAKAAPALRGSGAPEKQVAGRATEGALVPDAGKAAGRSALTAAEKGAVDRGLQELENKAAINAPPRPASTRFALTEEEKAAVERGLRELEKAAGQATP